MKITPVRSSNLFINASHNNRIKYLSNSDFSSNKSINSKTLAFLGIPLDIIDGGNHATNMQHFAKAINPDFEIKMVSVNVNPKDDDYYIRKNKIYLKGDYVNRSQTLFFRTNKLGQVIFPKCDCEGSGKSSVLSMWRCCFGEFTF